jgi:hypothetical protein
MTDLLPPADFPDLGVSRILFFALKFVVVAGGALVGWFVAPMIVRLLVRLAFQRETPRTVQTLSRFGGALLGGFLAYLIPLGGLGSGDGFGGGGGAFPGSGQKDRGKDTGIKDKKPRKNRPGTRAAPGTLAVYMLGGDEVEDDRYYQVTVKGKKRKLTAAQVRRLIVQGRKGPRRLRRLEIHFDDDSVDETNPAVAALEQAAEDNGLTVVRIVH